MATRIAVTRKLPPLGERMLDNLHQSGTYEVKRWQDDLPPDAAALAELLSGADGAITLLTETLDGALLDRHPDLKVISNLAVGHDNIDVAAATERGIAVCNTPGVLTDATADLAFALLMATARRLPEAQQYVRNNHWKTWSPTLLLGQELTGATVGVVGFGRIGREFARRATGFRMRILAFDLFPDQAAADELGASFVSLDELLQESDFVSLHCTLTPETQQLIGARELGLMKKSAILINAARGPVVDTDALVAALRTGEIWAAGLDVTDPEPIAADHPLAGLPNCLVVPHIASGTTATRNAMAKIAIENCVAVLEGREPVACVNWEALGKKEQGVARTEM
jgi:glyoxylate reductase